MICRFAVFLIICLLAGCSSVDPSEMAKEFCECMNQNTDSQQCSELAREHKDNLSGNKDKMQKYADEVLNCTNVSK